MTGSSKSSGDWPLTPTWVPGWTQNPAHLTQMIEALGWTPDDYRVADWPQCFAPFFETARAPSMAKPARAPSTAKPARAPSTKPGASPLREIARLVTRAPLCVPLAISMGGMLAMRGVLARPERVAGLVLIGSTACMIADNDDKPGGDPGTAPSVLGAMRLRLRRDSSALLAEFRRAAFAPFPSPPDDQFDPARLTAERVAVLDWGLRYLAAEDLRDALVRIDVPTLIVHGRDDRIIPLAGARRLAKRLPHARLEILDGQGHALIHTACEPLANLIEAFLEELRRPQERSKLQDRISKLRPTD
jgi:pimeloyl-[acyl-carrier protein] methyl ester esterase